jgi:hypothetical protein
LISWQEINTALLQFQPLALSAARAKQINRRLAKLIVKFGDEFKVRGAAFYAGHVKQRQQCFVAGFLRLIIFPAHEISGGIHGHSLKQSTDNRRPSHQRIDAD